MIQRSFQEQRPGTRLPVGKGAAGTRTYSHQGWSRTAHKRGFSGISNRTGSARSPENARNEFNYECQSAFVVGAVPLTDFGAFTCVWSAGLPVFALRTHDELLSRQKWLSRSRDLARRRFDGSKGWKHAKTELNALQANARFKALRFVESGSCLAGALHES